jgi:hypothetical protein
VSEGLSTRVIHVEAPIFVVSRIVSTAPHMFDDVDCYNAWGERRERVPKGCPHHTVIRPTMVGYDLAVTALRNALPAAGLTTTDVDDWSVGVVEHHIATTTCAHRLTL